MTTALCRNVHTDSFAESIFTNKQMKSGEVLMITKSDALWLGELHKVLLRWCRASKDRDGWMEGPARAGLICRICRGV